jgi:large subunit ribosomal protein L18
MRRHRSGKTDYHRRRQTVAGRRPFITVFRGTKNLLVQIHEAKPQGDLILASAHSAELQKFGWKTSRKSIPASYLTGLLAGVKAKSKGIAGAILYTGVKNLAQGSRVAAAVKGLRDTGLNVLADEEIFPSDKRLRGEHISAYIESLGKTRTNQFSALVKKGFTSQSIQAHIDEVKSRIMEAKKI